MNTPSPPRPPVWLLRFFRWFCHPDYVEDIEGDLLERFSGIVEETEINKARRRFFIEVLLLFRLSLIRPFDRQCSLISYSMLKHNILISFRGFMRHKTTFIIHLIGLSTGLSCASLIYLWVQDELRIDKFHKHDAHLYQVMQEFTRPDEIQIVDWTPGPLAEAILEELPGIRYATSYKTHPVLGGGIVVGDQRVRAIPIYVDQSYLEVFSFPLLHGNKSQVLTDKYAAVISEELARKLFGKTEEAIGQIITWEKKDGDLFDMTRPLIVSGVFQTIPDYSTEKFDVLLSIEFYTEYNPGLPLWTNDQGTTALVLEEGTDINKLAEKISQLSNSHTEFERTFVLNRYSSKYLYNQYENGVQTGGRITYVWLFSIIAILILLIACINFMNLSTAKASIRLKEIAVKKTLGASRNSLFIQFVSESLLISFLALIVALICVVVLFPSFNELTGKHMNLDLSLTRMLAFLGITLFTGLVSSTYPALYLSAFKPIQILTPNRAKSGREVWTRKSLVVFQFAISTFFIVCVLVIYQQMSFVSTKNLGIEKDHILSMKIEGPLKDKVEPFLAELRKRPEVVQAASSNHILVGAENWTTGINWEGRAEDERLRINPIICNYYFVETYGIRIKEGRSFSPEFGTDSSKVILNEAAVRKMRLENPIGQIITFWGDQVEIIGIAENFHFESLYKQIGPCILKMVGTKDNFEEHIWIKIRGGQEKESIKAIEQLYAEFNTGYTFEYGFVDESYLALYESENKVSVLSKYFAFLAILISCLGLFGLAAFTAERRKKEIGIRRVLGASVWSLTNMLSRSFTKMVLLAIVIALPISYLVAHHWLENFAYRIELEWWLFALAAIVALVIAWMTVGFQTFRAAKNDPVKSLRTE
ncbi:MAG: ABC transporter permease [Bacteroidota bacterium]